MDSLQHALIFFVKVTEARISISFVFKNKGAEKKTLRRRRAQLLVFSRVLIIAILFDVLLIFQAKMEKLK
jgi:hypothetical protein